MRWLSFLILLLALSACTRHDAEVSARLDAAEQLVMDDAEAAFITYILNLTPKET